MAANIQAVELPVHNQHAGGRIFQLCDEEKDDYVRNAIQKELRHGRGPYVVNGVPISSSIEGCCNTDPCSCRSDVIFYDGVAYDQKQFIQGHLRIRPGNTMYFEGKMVGPFTSCYNRNKYGEGQHQCCTSSIYGDSIPPYHNTHGLAYTSLGLPHGNTIGYFRFKPERICYDREKPVERIDDCCNCLPFEYDASQYIQGECPGKTCC